MEEPPTTAAAAADHKVPAHPAPRPQPPSPCTTDSGADVLSLYFTDLHRFPLLTQEEEAALGRLSLGGDENARHGLVQHNLRFAVSQAMRYRSHGAPLEDLIQQANLGMMRAARHFDPAFGVRFVTYAMHWIHQAIQSWLVETRRPLRLPAARAAELRALRRAAREFRQGAGRNPTAGELAALTGVGERDVQVLLLAGEAALPLDARRAAGDDTSADLAERLGGIGDSAARAGARDRELAIEAVLKQLRPRDAEVLRLRFGLATGRPFTLEETGLALGITRERVRQVEHRALAQLREAAQGGFVSILRDYL
jgi:RNA polymerase primary sigma factor